MLSREMDPNRGRSGRVRPQLEPLEDRCCPSNVFTHGHTLFITGDATNNQVTIRDDGHGDVTATVVDGHGHRSSLTAHHVQQINLRSTGGNDTIDYLLTGTLTRSEQLDFNLGSGNDTLNLDFSKGTSAPQLGVRIDGGRGADQVSAVFGAIENTKLNFVANLGNGPDQFAGRLNGDLTGTAKASFDVEGGTSYDGIGFQVHANIASTATLGINTNGGPGKDTLRVDYTGRVDGRLAVTMNGGANDDWVESNLNVAPGSKGSINAGVRGGPGNDLLILRVYDHSHHLHSLSASMNGDGGQDECGGFTKNVVVHNCAM